MAKKQLKGQGELMDTAHPASKKIIGLARKYRNLRDDRMAAQKPELEARSALLAAMVEAKMETFEWDGYVVEVVHGKDKVRVRATEDEEDETDEGGDGDGE